MAKGENIPNNILRNVRKDGEISNLYMILNNNSLGYSTVNLTLSLISWCRILALQSSCSRGAVVMVWVKLEVK